MIRAVIFDMYETLITLFRSPLYFGRQMAEDANIPEEKFQELWRPTEEDRTIGNLTLEQTIEMILRRNQCFSEQLLNLIVKKRIASKEASFEHLHPQIITMLESLKRQGILIGLISNCFSEEAEVIRKSVLFPYFDAVCLSYEQRIQKPDAAIFRRCLDQLSVKPQECLYVGDGGSRELEAAKQLGMHAMQAVWYLQEGTSQPTGRKDDVIQIEAPLDVLNYID